MNHILDDTIRREAQLQRFATYLVREYVNPSAQDLGREISALLIGYEELNGSEQRSLYKRIRELTRQQWGGIWSGVNSELPELLNDEADFQHDLYDDFAPEDLVRIEGDQTPIPPMRLDNQAGVWSQFVAANVDDTVKQVDALVQRGVVQGLTVSEMAQQLRGTYNRRTRSYQGGLLTGKQAKRAEALVRTGVSHHTSAVRDNFAKQNDDVIEKRIFFATLDSRTTTICLSNHLREWDIDDKKYPRLPLHYNERSVYIFKTPGFNPLSGTRPAVGGKGENESNFEQVKANVSAEAWLRRQPRWFVEESLGRERAKLFLDGNLKIKSMVDISNRPLTLAQLRETQAGARAYRRADNG